MMFLSQFNRKLRFFRFFERRIEVYKNIHRGGGMVTAFSHPFRAETGGWEHVIEFIVESEAETIENVAYRC